MKPLHVVLLLSGSLLVLSCDRGLSHSLRRDINGETSELQSAYREVGQAETKVRNELAVSPDLFRNVSAPAEWNAKFRSAREKLDAAQRDVRELEGLAQRDRSASEPKAHQLLGEERELRRLAVQQAKEAESAAIKWHSFASDPRAGLSRMEEALSAIQKTDFEPVSKVVEKAENDWPAKKSELEGRLTSIKNLRSKAEADWESTKAVREQVASGNLTGPQLATLITTDEELTTTQNTLATESRDLTELSGQLYDSWDKILADLEISHFGRDPVFRERLETVRTHRTDSPTTQNQITKEDHWQSVSEQAYRSVENDIGMTIAHKDAGLFDSEAQNTPQPPGFAYVAPVDRGSNQYGYWTHSGGQTFWTFLPEYLVLRELLRSHDYRPIYVDEYRGYNAARAAGRTYYGGTSYGGTARVSTPTYGTHGSFTAKNYASSRYVQSGGFNGSAYASRPGGSGFLRSSQPHAEAPHSSSFRANENTSGKRFGSGVSPSSGRRFGRSGGFRAPGRSFGRGR